MISFTNAKPQSAIELPPRILKPEPPTADIQQQQDRISEEDITEGDGLAHMNERNMIVDGNQSLDASPEPEQSPIIVVAKQNNIKSILVSANAVVSLWHGWAELLRSPSGVFALISLIAVSIVTWHSPSVGGIAFAAFFPVVVSLLAWCEHKEQMQRDASEIK
jgi:hypothetical protein